MDYWKCRGRCVDGIRTLDLGKCFSAPNCDVTLDCSATSADCNFDPGTQGYPEHGMADFSPVAPGWSASFDSASAISMGLFSRTYEAEFGTDTSFALNAPGGCNSWVCSHPALLSASRPGLPKPSPGSGDTRPMGCTRTQCWPGTTSIPAHRCLDVTTFTPGPGSFLLFGSALAALSVISRRTLH